MITPGGESAFVSRMVHESLEHGTRCRYEPCLSAAAFWMMVVRLQLVHVYGWQDVLVIRHRCASSPTQGTITLALCRQVKRKSVSIQVSNYAITEFVQGQTRRWGIAWSFTDRRLPDVCRIVSCPNMQFTIFSQTVARTSSHALHDIIPARNELRVPLPHASSIEVATDVLADILASMVGISLERDDRDDRPSFVVRGTGNTWSRAARRGNRSAAASNDCMMCRITVESGVLKGRQCVGLDFQWVRGEDRAMYESFCNHIGRKVEQRLAP